MSTLVTWLALLLAVVALGYAWTLQQTIHSLTKRLDRYNKALFELGDEQRELKEEIATTAAQLRFEIKKGDGQEIFTPQMTVSEAQAAHPQAPLLMASLRLGGCSSCAEDSLSKAAHDHGVDIQLLLTNLNKLAQGELTDVQAINAPNVVLEFE